MNRLGALASQGAERVARASRRAFPGHLRQAAHARRFVARALGCCPVTEVAILLTSELVTNAIAHSASGGGGMFEVMVWRGAHAACVAVLDEGADTTPAVGCPGTDDESGRGLGLVALLSADWGHEGGMGGRVVWFVLRWDDE